jgi:hypothetical protein
MNRISDLVKNYPGENPFKDSQAKTFSDAKVISEFYPTSIFWSLFNEQHEVLIGTRGSGKTILLKMMRYSLLKHINSERAKQIVSSKSMIALYVPMNLEFLGEFIYQDFPENIKIKFFEFAFNCLLAESFLTEVLSMIDDIEDLSTRAKKNIEIAKQISSIWFQSNSTKDFTEISSLITGIKKIYYSKKIGDTLDDISPSFTKAIGSSVQSVEHVLVHVLSLTQAPTWIVCIDEAEFLSPCFQRCINTLFRGDSKRIVIKMATLPFSHCTKETLIPGVFAESDGNDFNYLLIDMKNDSDDFVQVTNNLCTTRIKKQLTVDNEKILLEDFLGKIGDDDHIDYFRQEVGGDVDRNTIETGIINDFSDKRKTTASTRKIGDNNYRKEGFDKFAPIYFYREMFKLSRNGHCIPGWFAGSNMVRRISQGNPRRFIQIMNHLFDRARKGSLTSKAQHEEVLNYAVINCEATQGLPLHGPEAILNLDAIAVWLHKRVHDGPLIYAGNTFKLEFPDFTTDKSFEWIKLAVAYLRLIVDDTSLLYGLNNNTTYTFANTFCAKYWLPMRVGDYPKLKINSNGKYTYQLNPKEDKNAGVVQVSLFDEGGKNGPS